MTGVKDTAYTDDDMREFGKDILREWRRAYRAETDPVEEEKLTRRKKTQVRTQRMRQVSPKLTFDAGVTWKRSMSPLEIIANQIVGFGLQ